MFDGSVVVIMLCVGPKGPRPDWTVMQLNLCLTLWLSSHHFVLMQPSGPLRVTPCWRMKLCDDQRPTTLSRYARSK
jgi:hypothetical protein